MQPADKSHVSAGYPLDERDDAAARRRATDVAPASAGAIRIAVRRDAAPPSPLHPSPDELARRVAASLGAAQAGILAAALAACARDPACYEASVRGGPCSVPSAGRMMIERASPDVLDAIAHALGVVLPPARVRWLELAGHEGVPIIAGWDLRSGGNERCVKLYVNASDASRGARTRLCAALASGVAGGDDPPAVIGMNARADGVVETKLYVQFADAVRLAKGAGARARALAAAARNEGADAGGLLSFDAVGHVLQPRAFFVALREPPDGAGWRCVRSLPGYDPCALESLLPFAPAPPRSVGISLSDGAWTLYCKPRDSGRAPEALEPVAIFRLGAAEGAAEVGVFVEPAERAAHAFSRTERHAVSVRVRDGAPAPRALESLVDWFTARLRAAERDGARIATRLLANPPAPWRSVDATQPSGDPRERP
jgi:hypothetical protein